MCYTEDHVRRIAAEAVEWQRLGVKQLPGSAGEFHYIRQVNAVNGGDTVMLAVCEQQSINRPRRHRCMRRR